MTEKSTRIPRRCWANRGSGVCPLGAWQILAAMFVVTSVGGCGSTLSPPGDHVAQTVPGGVAEVGGIVMFVREYPAFMACVTELDPDNPILEVGEGFTARSDLIELLALRLVVNGASDPITVSRRLDAYMTRIDSDISVAKLASVEVERESVSVFAVTLLGPPSIDLVKVIESIESIEWDGLVSLEPC